MTANHIPMYCVLPTLWCIFNLNDIQISIKKSAICWHRTQMNLPVFVHTTGLQIKWISYHVVAGGAHLGDDSNSGHWCAALFHSGQMLLADDFEVPCRMIWTEEFSRNIYLLWLMPQTHRNRMIWSRPLPNLEPDIIAMIADHLAN